MVSIAGEARGQGLDRLRNISAAWNYNYTYHPAVAHRRAAGLFHGASERVYV